LSDERPDESEEPDDEEVSDEAEEPEEPDDEEVSDEADEPDDVPLAAALALESPPLAPSESPEPALAPTCLKLDPPRSFFAQPDPLKWIAGTANCLRIDPSAPHDGQKSGPGSLIP
jgi:hypothetical protein